MPRKEKRKTIELQRGSRMFEVKKYKEEREFDLVVKDYKCGLYNITASEYDDGNIYYSTADVNFLDKGEDPVRRQLMPIEFIKERHYIDGYRDSDFYIETRAFGYLNAEEAENTFSDIENVRKEASKGGAEPEHIIEAYNYTIEVMKSLKRELSRKYYVVKTESYSIKDFRIAIEERVKLTIPERKSFETIDGCVVGGEYFTTYENAVKYAEYLKNS